MTNGKTGKMSFICHLDVFNFFACAERSEASFAHLDFDIYL
jgi:hypothetical protein